MSEAWFVTGASSGIGKLITAKLLVMGENVVGTSRQAACLDDFGHSYPGRFRAVKMDLSKSTSIESAVDVAFSAFTVVKRIVCNAGFGTFGAVEELGGDQVRRQIDENLIGTILFIRQLIPRLRAAGGERILQVTSEGGRMAYPAFSTYHASKWGQEGFLAAVAQEVAPFGIELCACEPGPTATNFGGAMDRGTTLPVCADTPVGAVRDGFNHGTFPITGDADKMAQKIIETAMGEVLPRRVPLGSAAWNRIAAELGKAKALHGDQRDVAFSCDLSGETAGAG